MSKPVTIALSGLHRGQNPQPGCGVARGLRAGLPGCRLVGLVYDTWESGAYEPGLFDAIWTMPYPRAGGERWIERFAQVAEAERIDLLIPNLDAEIETLLPVQERLAEPGVHTTMPERDAFDRRQKDRLAVLCREIGVPHPRSIAVSDPTELLAASQELGFPLVVKGRLYGARVVSETTGLQRAVAEFGEAWGFPVILQERIDGEEYNLAGVGDGEGGLIGMVAQHKCLRSPEGKGLGGVTVDDPALDDLAARLVSGLRWRGPFELELIRSADSPASYLLEMNPRFPAWIELAVGLGCNLPVAAAELAIGNRPAPLPRVAAGSLFVRHSYEIVTHISKFGSLTASGVLNHSPGVSPK